MTQVPGNPFTTRFFSQTPPREDELSRIISGADEAQVIRRMIPGGPSPSFSHWHNEPRPPLRVNPPISRLATRTSSQHSQEQSLSRISEVEEASKSMRERPSGRRIISATYAPESSSQSMISERRFSQTLTR